MVKTNVDKLCEEMPMLNKVYGIFLEQHFVALELALISQKTKNAKTRYNELLDHNPDVFQKASLGEIASLLGINKAILSRLRRYK
jgi:hypothetical protein